MTKDSPLTVAGAAAALGKFPRTAFPFDPQMREPSRISRSLPGRESMLIVRARAFARIGYAFCSQSPLVPDLNHCKSLAASGRCRLRTMDEHSERHGDGRH